MPTYPRIRSSSSGRVTHVPYTVWKRAFKTNLATNTDSYPNNPQTETPTTATNGVHELSIGNSILVAPYSATAAPTSDILRGAVQLWYPVYDKVGSVKNNENVDWVGVMVALIDFTSYADTTTAAKAGALVATDAFCAATKTAAGTSFPGVDQFDGIVTSGNNPDKALTCCRIATKGAKYVQFYVDYDGYDFRITSTPCNYLFAEV